MTVAATLTSLQYTGIGVTSQFSFPNKIFSASDLVITVYDTSGNSYPFVNFANATLGWTYSVQGVDVDTGCIVVLSNVLTSGWVIDIRSLIPDTQSTSIKNQGQFLPELHEEAFDRATRMIQDLLRRTYTYGIHGPDTEIAPWPALPSAALRKGYALMFDGITGLPGLGFLSALNVTIGLLAPLLNLNQTAAELAAGVTPTNFAYPMLNPYRYGADGTGGTNDATAYVAVNAVIAKLLSGVAGWLDGLSVPGYWKTPQEIAAGVVPKSYQYPPDGTDMECVFRFMTEVQIADVLAGTATQDVSAAIQAANDYVEGKAAGAISTLGSLIAGTGYNGGNPGTFNIVALTGGHGQFVLATVVVGIAGAISSITIGYSGAGNWLGNPGNGYQIGDVLTLTSANMVVAGAASGGSGCTINVTGLATGGKTGTVTPGGSLFFPSGRYYCGTSGLRVGDMVRWLGTSVSGTQFSWNSAFNGNRITLGPDASGFNGRGGVYGMGTNLERCTVNATNGTGWGIYTTGLQQNGRIKDVWAMLGPNSTGGVFLQDHFGSANILCEDVYTFPPSGGVSGTAVGFHLDGGANLELNRCSCNGGGGTLLLAGVAVVSAGASVKIKNFECELSVTHIDIAATAGEGVINIDQASMNLGGSPAGSQALWIHSGFTGTVNALGLDCGNGQMLIRNDNTGESRLAGAGGALMNYIWSGTSTDVSIFQNTLVIPALLQVNPPPSTILNVDNLSSFDVNVANATAVTIAPPTITANAMPSSGRTGQQLWITVRNISGGAINVSWNAVFKLSTWTSPASSNSRSILFKWNGSNWVQVFQGAVDVPN